MTPLERITARVNRNGDLEDSKTPRPILTLEEFFEGNNVSGSICCNCTPTPTPAEVYETLKRIRARKDVYDVLVEIYLFDQPEWPFSEVVWVITAAGPNDVKGWYPESFAPDECSEGLNRSPREAIEVPAAFRAVWCWWD